MFSDRLLDKDLEFARKYKQPRQAAWLNTWGAQLTLTLTIEETSALDPNAVWLPLSPPSAIFTLGGGGNISADATRTETLNFYYK